MLITILGICNYEKLVAQNNSRKCKCPGKRSKKFNEILFMFTDLCINANCRNKVIIVLHLNYFVIWQLRVGSNITTFYTFLLYFPLWFSFCCMPYIRSHRLIKNYIGCMPNNCTGYMYTPLFYNYSTLYSVCSM